LTISRARQWLDGATRPDSRAFRTDSHDRGPQQGNPTADDQQPAVFRECFPGVEQLHHIGRDPAYLPQQVFRGCLGTSHGQVVKGTFEPVKRLGADIAGLHPSRQLPSAVPPECGLFAVVRLRITGHADQQGPPRRRERPGAWPPTS
jgi:hypothetical protein